MDSWYRAWSVLGGLFLFPWLSQHRLLPLALPLPHFFPAPPRCPSTDLSSRTRQVDGCLTWLSEGFEDLGLALYPEGKAANKRDRELTLSVTFWGWACSKIGLWMSLHSPQSLQGSLVLHDPFPDAGGGRCTFPWSPTAPPSREILRAAFPALTLRGGWRWWPHILGPRINRCLLSGVSH